MKYYSVLFIDYFFIKVGLFIYMCLINLLVDSITEKTSNIWKFSLVESIPSSLCISLIKCGVPESVQVCYSLGKLC